MLKGEGLRTRSVSPPLLLPPTWGKKFKVTTRREEKVKWEQEESPN